MDDAIAGPHVRQEPAHQEYDDDDAPITSVRTELILISKYAYMHIFSRPLDTD